MPQKFQFRVKNSDSGNYILATKFGDHSWHYFEEEDSILSRHDSLPYGLEYIMDNNREMQTIELSLTEEQAANYYQNGNFIFKNSRLKTFVGKNGKSPEPVERIKRKTLLSENISFLPGETNPLLFLAHFEKCDDINTDQDKKQKLRHFVHEDDKPKFSTLQFTGDWSNMKKAFLVKYSLPFIKNKKKDMDVTFGEEPSLRLFFQRKFESYEKYTTMPLINQMEMILNELPAEIAQFFMVNEKFDSKKEDILDFCDRIQDVVGQYNKDKDTQESHQRQEDPSQRMGSFNFVPESDDESDEPMLQDQLDVQVPSTSRGKRGRGRGRGGTSTGKIVKRVRPKKLIAVPEEISDNDDYDFLDQMSSSSNSSWSHN